MNIRVLKRFWLLSLLLPTLAQATTVQVFSRANILDVENQLMLENHFFILEDEKVAFVGNALPEQYQGKTHRDLAGAYVMPGLIDAHAHISLGPTNFKKERGMLLLHASS